MPRKARIDAPGALQHVIIEDPYLKELVRYIHLNPLRAGLVEDMKELDKYPWCGHSVLMDETKHSWQNIDYVYSLFSGQKKAARKIYRAFVEKGIAAGNRPNLSGGGLLRSSGGWFALKGFRKAGIRLKGDERILGDSDFVENVLKTAAEPLEQKYKLQAGSDFICCGLKRMISLPPRWAIADCLFRGCIDLLGCQEHRDPACGCSAGTDGQRERRRADVVRYIRDYENIGFTEGIVEGLHLTADRPEQLLDGFAAAGAALFEQPLESFTDVIGLNKILWHGTLLPHRHPLPEWCTDKCGKR